MIMTKKDLMNMSARITPDIQGRLIGMIADYLKDNGGSLDMDFHMQTASYDNFEEDDRHTWSPSRNILETTATSGLSSSSKLS